MLAAVAAAGEGVDDGVVAGVLAKPPNRTRMYVLRFMFMSLLMLAVAPVVSVVFCALVILPLVSAFPRRVVIFAMTVLSTT
jgi:hypothetical protein